VNPITYYIVMATIGIEKHPGALNVVVIPLRLWYFCVPMVAPNEEVGRSNPRHHTA